jgi:two-component system NtrC family sensor kinase
MSPDDPGYLYIHEIKRESKRCKKIVQDLLSYARTPKPDMEMTDINLLLDQIVNFAANHTDMYHVTVAKEFGAGLPEILVDGDQLRQVAINLILNSGSAMPKGGKLVVSTRLAEDGFIEIAFADTGAGIPPENLEKIFEPFFTTKEKGTGLGLAITKQIIEMHHGTVSIDSRVGEGTTVKVRLPVDQEEL